MIPRESFNVSGLPSLTQPYVRMMIVLTLLDCEFDDSFERGKEQLGSEKDGTG